jgi:hypothetical protein
MWFAVLAGLMILNEIGRARKWTGIAMFIILPAVLSVAVWPKTVPGTDMNDWFHWFKVYSALAGCIGFMVIRYSPSLQKNKWALAFPPFILAFNILEAVARDFQVYSFHGIHDGMMLVGGSWNIMNGVAGIINIVTLTGWLGIYAGKGKSKDMIWADQLWFWIIAYDLWNYAYTYNCLPDHSFYAGLALLISCTIPTFFIKKGAWLQHRAQTLAIWCMFARTFTSFADTSKFAVHSSHNPKALFIVSFIAIVFNVGVLLFELKTVLITGRNPLKGHELYSDLKSYKKVIAATKEIGGKSPVLEPVAAN